MEKEYEEDETYLSDCLTWGGIISKEMQQKIKDLKSVIANDMMEMDNVEDFLKNK